MAPNVKEERKYEQPQKAKRKLQIKGTENKETLIKLSFNDSYTLIDKGLTGQKQLKSG